MIETLETAYDRANYIAEETQEVLLSDNRGVYIPRDFVEIFREELRGQLNEWEEETILRGPFDNPDYWEAWVQAESRGITIEGKRIALDGDLWLIDDDLREQILSRCPDREAVEDQLFV
jgi:hypothetical protein